MRGARNVGGGVGGVLRSLKNLGQSCNNCFQIYSYTEINQWLDIWIEWLIHQQVNREV